MSAADTPWDTAAVLADDALLDGIGAEPGRLGSAGIDGIGTLLERWSAELDSVSVAAPAVSLPLRAGTAAVSAGSVAGRRGGRIAAMATAALVLLAGSGVAAAAVSGPTGPFGALHRALFGTSATADPMPAAVTALLDDADRQITVARSAGGSTALQRRNVAAILGRAALLLRADARAPDTLRERLSALRRLLAALPILAQSEDRPTHPTPSATALPGNHPTSSQRRPVRARHPHRRLLRRLRLPARLRSHRHHLAVVLRRRDLLQRQAVLRLCGGEQRRCCGGQAAGSASVSDPPIHRQLADLRKFSITAGDSVRLIPLAGPAEGSSTSVYFEVWDPLGSQPVNSHPGSCEVFIILSGNGRAYSDETVIDLAPGDVLVLPEKSAHRIENLSATERMYAVTVMVHDSQSLEGLDGGFAQLVTQGIAESLDPLDVLTLLTGKRDSP